MLAIQDEIKKCEASILELQKEGTEIVAELDSWRTNLPFGLPAIAAKPPKSEGKNADLKIGLKLALKRSIARAFAEGCTKDVAASIADTAGRRFVERRNAELPLWVGEWSKQMIDKTFPQPQVETAVAEVGVNEQIESVPTKAPKATKKQKK
jgi:hypothetical protein